MTFRKALALIHLAAFLSLGWQAEGLFGSDGILPSLPQPGLFCILGALLAVLLFTDFYPQLILLALWSLYLALFHAGQVFLNYQMDRLLLEVTLIAALPSPKIARFLFFWLLFRMHLVSGLLKIATGDPSWANWTALSYHYETQPIPHALSWYAHQLPAAFHRFSTAGTLVIEIVAPLLLLGPRSFRRTGLAAMAILQIMIMLTGNYAFLNLLTLAVIWAGTEKAESRRSFISAAWGALVMIVSISQILALFQLASPVRALAPLASINLYGMFGVIETERREIVIEGTLDGKEWREYEFKYKPGRLDRRPAWSGPHYPRLDWQMWFEALAIPNHSEWFKKFLEKLKDGEPTVLRLVKDPFDGEQPKEVRVRYYIYRFDDETWWTRSPLSPEPQESSPTGLLQ